MSIRISRKDFAGLLGIHEKTVERYHGSDDNLTDDQKTFRESTGYHKNPMNGRVTFDDQFARIFAANLTGDDSLRTHEGGDPGVIDAEEVTGQELVAAAPVASMEHLRGRETNGADFVAAFTVAQILPHKLILTLAEAADLSGVSRSQLKPFCRWSGGRWKIERTALDSAVKQIWKAAETAAPVRKSLFGKPVKKGGKK